MGIALFILGLLIMAASVLYLSYMRCTSNYRHRDGTLQRCVYSRGHSGEHNGPWRDYGVRGRFRNTWTIGDNERTD